MKNIGVDLTKISRFANKDINFAKRILSISELAIYKKVPKERKPLFLARTWAIKEAIFKANNDYAKFTEIDLSKKDKKWVFKNFSISISHDDDFIIAFVVEND
ncbi:ACP synthase [Mycoplasmopsis gallinacea]|uniref:ACP synthase n=1 Tax=Mycoplasmopsis gallinacea TaxID=29556 RepID=A0A0D5ZJK1_9BACT|nr:ACP synthase [Mycoplasmopsis gallinacea]